MKLNQAGIDLIKHLEGCRLTAYRDEGGVWTIGYGETHDVHEGMTITQERADAMLMADLAGVSRDVAGLAHGSSLTANQFASLVSFTYNAGVSAFKTSHLRARILAGDLYGAADEFLNWVYVKGAYSENLAKRRAAEVKLFLTP